MTNLSHAISPADRLLGHFYRRRWRGFHFLHRLRQRVSGRVALRGVSRYGSRFDLSPDDYISGEVLRRGYYESEVMEALRSYLGPGAVFWDVGANLGLHAVTAKTLAPETTVVAFEPNRLLAEKIRHNASLNCISVTVLPVALGARSGEATLHLVTSGNSGMSTLHPAHGAGYDTRVKVPVHRGEDLIARGELPHPTVMKIDVEGAEADVLAGLGAWLWATTLRAVVFESEPGLVNSHPTGGLARTLHAAGFALRALHRNEPTAHGLDNYLAFRGVTPATART